VSSTATPRHVLGDIVGGKVLDVATGAGGFVSYLLEGLQSFDEIVGIDVSDKGRQAFSEAFADKPNVSFEVMDGHALKFARSSWDTVAISNSLHHFEDPRPVLDEMWRVLKPGGAFIVFEMYRDRQSPAQLTHVWLHHWAADLDRSQGIVHRHTYRRTDLVDLVRGLSLDPVRTAEISDTVADPKDEATMAWHESLIERQLDRAGGDRRLVRSGERVRQRLRDVGIQGATELLFVGRKPA